MATTPTQYRLQPDTLDQLQRIADHLTGLTGMPHSRAAAIRFAAKQVAETLSPQRDTTIPKKRQKILRKTG